MINKLNQIPHISQQKHQETLKYFINSLLPHEMKLLQLLVWFNKSSLRIYCAQEYLGLKTGYTRETVNRLLRRFRDVGLITWIYRHRHTCIYSLASIFDDPEMQKFLGNYIQGVYYLPKRMLLSIRKVFQSAYKWTKKRPSGKKLPIDDVTPIKKLSYSFSSNISFLYRTKCIYDQGFTDSKGAKVELNRSEMVRSIESLKNTPMSEADVKAIAAYPDEVIAYADRCTNRKGSLANPIGYFLVCCREYNKKKLLGDSQSSRLETQNRSPQKGTAKPSPTLMTQQQIIANKERIDKLCLQNLQRRQANGHIKAYEKGLITKSLCERLLSAIGMLDTFQPQNVQPESNLKASTGS